MLFIVALISKNYIPGLQLLWSYFFFKFMTNIKQVCIEIHYECLILIEQLIKLEIEPVLKEG